jgi:aryl-alcohol dehydrogenase (NADP+)
LAGGWLTGKHQGASPVDPESRAGTNPDHFDRDSSAKHDAVEALQEIAAGAGVSVTHLALAWNVEHPAVTCALIGPRTEEQLDDLLGAAGLRLDEDVLDAIDAVVPPGTNLNPADPGWTPPGLDPINRRRS